MSDRKPDGGPAFPLPPTYSNAIRMTNGQPGMSLRDWFAGQALASMLTDFDYEKAARVSYEIADKMIKERDK